MMYLYDIQHQQQQLVYAYGKMLDTRWIKNKNGTSQTAIRCVAFLYINIISILYLYLCEK